MSKSAVLLLFLVLIVPCLMAVKAAFSSFAVVTENTWTQKAPMQEARGELGVAVVNDKIYAIGGRVLVYQDQSGVETKEVGTNEVYDPATDTWTFKAPMPTPRAGFAIAVFQNKIYCISSGVNEVYDPATDTWENKTAMPTARTALEANTVGEKIYLIGGFVYASSGFSGSRVTLNEVYDPATDTWTTAAPMPKAGLDYASAVFDNKIYFIDGYPDNPHPLRNQIFDPETDTWSQGSPSLSSTKHGAAGVTTGMNSPPRIYVLGETWDPLSSEPAYTVRVYDPASDMWAFGAAIPTNRLDFGVAVVNDLIYTIGGWTVKSVAFDRYAYTYYDTTEQYTPFGYGTVPPVLSVASPENVNYTSSNVALNFTSNKGAEWMGYSLDGNENVTVTGNATLTGLSSGLHNVTVYAKDEFGNTGASATVIFTVAEEPFPVVPVATASVASVALIGVGLLVYFKKRKR